MTPLQAQPSPEMGLDLLRDAVDVRRLPRWDPRYCGHVALEDEPRCNARFLSLALSWGKAPAEARAQRLAATLGAERPPHERDSDGQLIEHQLSLEPKHAIAGPSQHAVPPRISDASARVIAAVHFNHDASGGRTEIHDEAADDDLPLEADAELSAGDGLPEARLRRRKRSPHSGRASREQLSTSEIEFLFLHGSLLVPAKWPGVATCGAGSVTRARRVVRALTARGAERAPLGAARPLRRDEVRGEQRLARVQSTSSQELSIPPQEPTAAHPDASTQQARPQFAGAPPRRDDLPHSRAARAGVLHRALNLDAPRTGAREHEFGEGRAPAGGEAAEDARVGATPHDYRTPAEWPAGAQPLTKKIQYDDLYRATRIDYQAANGTDPWTSPFAPEIAGLTDPRRAKPGTHVSFTSRPLYQTFNYDWLGNTQASDDDAHGFYDRSLGTITNDTAHGHPYQLASASNKSGPAATRNGSFAAVYDAAGNLLRANLERNGPCLPSTAPCSSRFQYDWDEVGRLSRAFRSDASFASLPALDQDASGSLWITVDPISHESVFSVDFHRLNTNLDFLYDESDERIVKTATDLNGVSVSTLYPYQTLEVRGTALLPGSNPASTTLTADNEVPYLVAHGVRLGRVVFEEAPKGEPRVETTNASLHVFLELGDQLGSTNIVIDKATSEVVEAETYQGYGAKESDYRPDRWKGYREDYGFTGKEEDIEFGVVYFGKRFYSPYLNRWLSADPLAVHAPGSVDLNLYAYVHGQLFRSVDPLGLEGEGGANGGDPKQSTGTGTQPGSSKQEPNQSNNGWLNFDPTSKAQARAAGTAMGGSAAAMPVVGDGLLAAAMHDLRSKLSGDVYNAWLEGVTAGAEAAAVAALATAETSAGAGLAGALPSGGTTVLAGATVSAGALAVAANAQVVVAMAANEFGRGRVDVSSSGVIEGTGVRQGRPAPEKPPLENRPSGSGSRTGPIFKTNKEAAAKARELGFNRIKETSHGQAIFSDGDRFITRDVDGHNGGVWKMAESVEALGAKETRMGTYDVNLTRIGD